MDTKKASFMFEIWNQFEIWFYAAKVLGECEIKKRRYIKLHMANGQVIKMNFWNLIWIYSSVKQTNYRSCFSEKYNEF